MVAGASLTGLQRHFVSLMLSEMTPAEAVQRAAKTGNDNALIRLLAANNPGSDCCNDAAISAIRENHWSAALILLHNLREHNSVSFQTHNLAMIAAVQGDLHEQIIELLRIDANHCCYESIIESVNTENEQILLILLASGNLELHKRAKAALQAAHQHKTRIVDILLRGILLHQFHQDGLTLMKALREGNWSTVLEQLNAYVARTTPMNMGPQGCTP